MLRSSAARESGPLRFPPPCWSQSSEIVSATQPMKAFYAGSHPTKVYLAQSLPPCAQAAYGRRNEFAETQHYSDVTAKRRHSPGTPFSSCAPRSSWTKVVAAAPTRHAWSGHLPVALSLRGQRLSSADPVPAISAGASTPSSLSVVDAWDVDCSRAGDAPSAMSVLELLDLPKKPEPGRELVSVVERPS